MSWHVLRRSARFDAMSCTLTVADCPSISRQGSFAWAMCKRVGASPSTKECISVEMALDSLSFKEEISIRSCDCILALYSSRLSAENSVKRVGPPVSPEACGTGMHNCAWESCKRELHGRKLCPCLAWWDLCLAISWCAG